MNIDKGEFFVVKRGFKYHSVTVFPFTTTIDDGPRYDRSYEGMVFVANEVCNEHIAALCVYSEHVGITPNVGKMCTMNTTELEIWPVTNKYVEALNVKVKEIMTIIGMGESYV